MKTVTELASAAKEASVILSCAAASQKNTALKNIASALMQNEVEILSANAADIDAARKAGIPEVKIDRLSLSHDRLQAMADASLEIAAADDPVGEIISMKNRPNGLRVGKKRVPLGVIGIICESRPNVTVDSVILCLKSGNTCVLRGGKEAIKTNIALMSVIRRAVSTAGLPEDCAALTEDITRESANEMMAARGLIDVLIPRGGADLIQSVAQNARVPVIETGVGNCHVYVDCCCDLDMAEKIVFNAKTSRPSVCNAAETLLVHRSACEIFLPMVKKSLDKMNVEIRGCETTRAILGDSVTPATELDYFTEYNDYILAVRVVSSFDEAVAHIAKYGTKHSEAIVTNDYSAAQRFLDMVDAAAVYVNASTRFTDGAEFGEGAEIGISTQKMHARGPMGLEALTSIKYVIYGSGQIR